MKKIPTLFVREFDRGKVVRISSEVTLGCEWVLRGEGIATEKVDGAACAFVDGVFYKRYDVKRGQKRIPDGAIPCIPSPDPVTGHWPHWVPIDAARAENKWFVAASKNSPWITEDGTYEAVGPHFQTNPYGLDEDFLEKHGRIRIHDCPRDFMGIKAYLREHEIEGIVFWKDGKPGCKIKRRDFGYAWPVKWEEVCE